MLRIDHTDPQGTILDGTSRADGSAEILKACGWRWGRSIAAWYLPRSRNTAPRRALIERTAEQLRAAGHAVAVSIDDTPQDPAEREARIGEQAETRAEHLADRAQRHRAAAAAAGDLADAIGERIPLGQPVLLGHHSQRGHERDMARIHRATETHVLHAQQAREDEQAAATAGRRTDRRTNPVTVANRLDRLQADARRLRRALEQDAHDHPEWAQRATTELARLDSDSAYWQAVRAEQVATGQATSYGPTSVHRGDQVKIRGRWYTVVRANKRTVTVPSPIGNWTDTTPWHEVQDHRSASTSPAGQ